jgi:O-antigen/teichoic acid export membrane protein
MQKSENTGPPRPTDNSRIVATNTVWSSIEAFLILGVQFITSVAIARVIGKDAAGQARLGSYQYIVTLTTITLTMGSFGLSATTRKYMAEYLNRGMSGVARATYLATLQIQSYISLAAAAIGFAVVYWLGDRHYFAASVLLIIAIVPRLISTVPSQANNASEVTRRNTGPAIAGGMTSAALTIVSLFAGWDFVGLSAAVLVGSCLECGLKLRAVERWLGRIPRGTVPPDLQRRMFTYSGQGMALLLLNLVVWDRSDIFVLKALNPDARQIVFFSQPFSLADRILIIPTLFLGALASTMMAQYGRGESRLKEMTVDGGRYALLVALPLLAGLACISQPLVLLLYGRQYQPMVPTLAIIAVLAIPKALVTAPTMLLQTTERQGFLIVWGCICGAVDIGLDILLVGRHGANGAAVANGTAQGLAALGIWIYVWKADRLDLKLADWGRIAASGAIMSLGVLATTRAIPGRAGLVPAIAAGAVLWMVALRITAALRPQDVNRFLAIGRQFPAAVRPHWKSLISWLAPSVSVA